MNILDKKEMKRTASCTKKLDKTESKRAKLLDPSKEKRVVRHALVKSKRDTTKFLSGYVLKVPNPVFPQDTGPLIEKYLAVPEIAMLIISNLGPHELYIMTRVSWQFKIVTSNAFLNLAPFYLDRYTEEVTDVQVLGQFKFERTNLCTLLSEYTARLIASLTQNVLPPPPIEDMFALWFRVQRKYRCHCKSYVKPVITPHTERHIDYAFVYDTVEKRLVRLRDLNLYKSDKLNEIGAKFRYKWLEKRGFICPENEPTLSLLRLRDLEKMSFSRIEGDFKPHETFVFKDGHITNFLANDRYHMHYCAHPSVFPLPGTSRRAPFFDYYEQRIAYENHTNQIPAYPFKETIVMHRLRLSALCKSVV